MRRAFAFLLLSLVFGCAAERAATRPAPAAPGCGTPAGIPVSPRDPLPGRLCVALTYPTPPAVAESATVVLIWFRPEEQAKLFRGLYVPTTMLTPFLERARVVPNVALGDAQELELDYPGGDAVVVAIVDRTHAFWPTMFGGGAGNFIGVSAAAVDGKAAVKLDAIPAFGPPQEGCVGNRLELVRLQAPEVAGSVGNDVDRRLCVFLPPSYATDPARRYPVVYLVPGFSSTDTAYLRGNQDVRAKVDALAASGGGEAIVVGVDTSTKHGSTYFTDSDAGGKWDAFIPKMTAEIDRRYRTKAEAKSRAVVGHSTGGFNAVSVVLRHLDLFSVIGASSPDGLDFEQWLTEGGRVRPTWLAWTRLENGVGGMGQMVSYAAAWSSSGQQFPFDLQTGALDEGSWKAWRAQSPMTLLDDPATLARVKKELSGRIFLIVGKQDEFGLYPPTARFDARLTELGVAHQFMAVDTGHSTENVQHPLLFAIGAMK